MNDPIAALTREMEAAAAANDFERAKDCRDRIALLRGGADRETIDGIDLDGICRLAPGAMGLGTNHSRVAPPADWRPPAKPDPMTTGQKRRGNNRRARPRKER